MKLRSIIATSIGAVALAAAAVYAPSASADRVGFNVSVGGPGYGFSVGNYGYGYYDSWRPAPVYVAPYTPYYYQPYRSYYYDPVVIHPRPAYRYRHYDRHDHWRHRQGYRHGDGNHGAVGYVYSR
jgi:hypothetical protein